MTRHSFQPSEFHVDLMDPDIDSPWAEVCENEKVRKAAVELCDEIISDDYLVLSPAFFGAVKKLLALLFGRTNGRRAVYGKDMEEWAAGTDIDVEIIRLANLSYEVSAVAAYLEPIRDSMYEKGERIREHFTDIMRRLQRCTGVSFFIPKHGMIISRNMDWPLIGIKKHTILVHFNGPAGMFTSVSVPGMVGVLSGVAKGRFSASINASIDDTLKWRPNLRGWVSTFLLRSAFENCGTYDEAVDLISHADSMVPFFVQLAGPRRGQACVVSVKPKGNNRVYSYSGGPLAIANHELSGKYQDMTWMEDDEEYCTDSCQRLSSIERAVKRKKPKTLKGALGVLRHSPVMNGATQQSIVMCSKTGEILLNRL